MAIRLRDLPLGFALLLAACMPPLERFPVTREGQSMDAANARLVGSASPVAQAVTFERLVNTRSEPHNWLTYYGAYDARRFSPLEEIHRGNVAELRPAWIFQSGIIGLVANPPTYAFEAAPLLVDGVLYTTGPDGHVWALDARTGGMLWHYRHAVPLDVPLCCGNVNRGAAIAEGKVFVVTPNGHVVALDARTGEPVWTRVFADVRERIARAAGGQEPRAGRQLGRGVRRARPYRRVRSRHRRTALAALQRARAGRARRRDLARRQGVAGRRPVGSPANTRPPPVARSEPTMGCGLRHDQTLYGAPRGGALVAFALP